MSRAAAARRRRLDTVTQLAVCGRVQDEEGRLNDQNEQLREQNACLRERVAEVEGWYGLMQVDHVTLQEHDRQNSRRITELQVEVNRLDAENQELLALVDRIGGDDKVNKGHEERVMIRTAPWIRGFQKYKWAAAALMTIGTLLARDPSLQAVFSRAVAGVKRAAGSGGEFERGSEASGFVRYAAMINSRDQLEHVRKEYNAGEASLKGDALLEAQDRLRAAKARYRQARLAFLPELARSCQEARIALPRDSADALAALRSETAE